MVDEQKIGSMELPRPRINEALFILEKLKTLETYHKNNKKGHLVEMMPVFADLVMSNQHELKEHLRDIFKTISTSIMLHTASTEAAAGEGGSSGGEF